MLKCKQFFYGFGIPLLYNFNIEMFNYIYGIRMYETDVWDLVILHLILRSYFF